MAAAAAKKHKFFQCKHTQLARGAASKASIHSESKKKQNETLPFKPYDDDDALVAHI